MSSRPSPSAESPLFRDEALARFRSAVWQPALLSKPVSGYLLAALSLAAGMGVILAVTHDPRVLARADRCVDL